jgi:hypothetical protein
VKNENFNGFKDEWYEILGDWEKINEIYETKRNNNINNISIYDIFNQIKSLNYLCEWGEIIKLSKFSIQNLSFDDIEIKNNISEYGITSSVYLNDWENLNFFLNNINDQNS